MPSDRITFTIQDLRPVVLDLLHQEKRKLVFEMLDLYFGRAETLEDFDTLGYLSLKAEYRDLYLKCAEAAYTRAENSQQLYIARANLYKAYNALNRPADALFYINLNLTITPDDFETQTQKAFNIALLGDRKTSEDMLMKLAEKHPEKAQAMDNALSGKMLRDGKTAKGILSFMGSIKPKNGRFEEAFKMTKWTGMVQPNRTIYVDGEGGIGDEIINIRFFDHIKDLGMKPVLYSTWSKYREDTVNLFRRNGYEVITETYSIDRKQTKFASAFIDGAPIFVNNQVINTNTIETTYLVDRTTEIRKIILKNITANKTVFINLDGIVSVTNLANDVAEPIAIFDIRSINVDAALL
jgi:hypothetical protein